MDRVRVGSVIPIFSTIALLTAVCVAALLAVGGW
jgi:hypothetical protein